MNPRYGQFTVHCLTGLCSIPRSSATTRKRPSIQSHQVLTALENINHRSSRHEPDGPCHRSVSARTMTCSTTATNLTLATEKTNQHNPPPIKLNPHWPHASRSVGQQAGLRRSRDCIHRWDRRSRHDLIRHTYYLPYQVHA